MKKYCIRFLFIVSVFWLGCSYADPIPLAFFVNKSIHCTNIDDPKTCTGVPPGFKVDINNAGYGNKEETFNLFDANFAAEGLMYFYTGEYADNLYLFPATFPNPFVPVGYPLPPQCAWTSVGSYTFMCDSNDPKQCPYGNTGVLNNPHPCG